MVVLRMRPHRGSAERQVGGDNRTREGGGVEVENKKTAPIHLEDHPRIIYVPRIDRGLIIGLPYGIWVPVGVQVRDAHDCISEICRCVLRPHSSQIAAL